MEAALKYDASVLLDSATLPWEPFSPAGYPEGIRMRVLRRLDDGSLRSAVLDVPAGWSSGATLAGGVAEQGYVLSGALQVGTRGEHQTQHDLFQFHSPIPPCFLVSYARLHYRPYLLRAYYQFVKYL